MCLLSALWGAFSSSSSKQSPTSCAWSQKIESVGAGHRRHLWIQVYRLAALKSFLFGMGLPLPYKEYLHQSHNNTVVVFPVVDISPCNNKNESSLSNPESSVVTERQPDRSCCELIDSRVLLVAAAVEAAIVDSRNLQGDTILVEDFSNPVHKWTTMNDPVSLNGLL